MLLKNRFPDAGRKSRRAAARRGRRLRIMFTDEARFGRMNRIRPCWAPVGMRPEVAAQLIREYIYLYGAVSPKDGTCVYLIMPTSNTASFQAFLDVLARKFARQDILLVLDGAPNHRCGHLIVPDNITLLYLPPYSPELNPKENLWDEIREKIFKNYALKSMDPCALSSGRQSSISSAIPNWSALSPPSPISPTHSDVETVLDIALLKILPCSWSTVRSPTEESSPRLAFRPGTETLMAKANTVGSTNASKLNYRGTHIRLKQSKTGRRVVVRVGAPLKAALEMAKKYGPLILTNKAGRPWTSHGFQASWRMAASKAGIVGLTFHDLRGTAITRLALVGCTEAEIAAITGHSLRDVHCILDAHYLARDPALGESAIRKLEAGTKPGRKTPN